MTPKFKIPGLLLFLLLSNAVLFAKAATLNKRQLNLSKPVSDTTPTGYTPVYLGNKNYQVAVLQTDFPKVSANFSSAFPAATKQLWIKEDRALFVYFTSNETRVCAVFNKNGSMSYAIATIPLHSAPAKLKIKIEKSNPGYQCLNAKKILAGGNTSYQFVFDNEKEYIIIHTDEDDITGTKRIRKFNSN